MLRNIRSGIIHFGLVSVPVGVATAVASNKEPKFRTLHDKCKTPIKQKNFCETCDTDADETVKGFEFAKGEFVTFTSEEFEEIESSPSVQIKKFVRAVDIKPLMVSDSYWLTPSSIPKLSEAYGLLYQALAETKKAGLGFHSLWGKEHPCVVIPNQDYPSGGVLQLCTLNVGEDIVMPDFYASIPGREEKKLAKAIIDEYSGDLELGDLVSESRVRLNAMIAARVEGKDLPSYEESTPDEATELMESLKRMYDEVKGRKTVIIDDGKKKARSK